MLQFVPMAEKKSIAPESVIGLTQATEAVFAEHGFATRDMLEEAAEKKAKGLGKLVGANAYGSLEPVFQIRRKAGFTGPAPIRAINDLPVAVTQIEDIDGKEVTVFYLTERTVTQADGTITTVRQKAGEIQGQYIAYQEKRRAAITEREARAQEKRDQARDQAAETSRRQEAEKPPSTMNLHFLLYTSGESPQQLEFWQQSALKGIEGQTQAVEDYSAGYPDLMYGMIRPEVALQILNFGLEKKNLADLLDVTADKLHKVAQRTQEQAAELVRRMIEDISSHLEAKKGRHYEGIMPLQRQLLFPFIFELSRQLPQPAPIKAGNIVGNEFGFRTYAMEAVYSLLDYTELEHPTIKSKETIGKEFILHGIFTDILMVTYAPEALGGETLHEYQQTMDFIAQQFSSEEIISLLTVASFDHDKADREFADACRALDKGSGFQNRRRVNRKELVDQRDQALFRLHNETTVGQGEVLRRIHAAVLNKLPKQMPYAENYVSQAGKDPVAFTRAMERYGKKPELFRQEPKREDYEGGEDSYAYQRDKQLYFVWNNVVSRRKVN